MANRTNYSNGVTRQIRTWRLVVVGAAFVSAFAFGGRPSLGQFGGGRNEAVLENPNDPMVKAKIEALQGLHNASSEFRRAQGDAAKAAAQKKLLEALAKYFDEDMKVREDGLKKAEEQVKTLRAQLDKRGVKKQEILDLQLKVFENETEGLGFFGNSPVGVPISRAAAAVSMPWPSTDRYDGPPRTFIDAAPPQAATPPLQERSVVVPTPVVPPPSPDLNQLRPNETKTEPPKR